MDKSPKTASMLAWSGYKILESLNWEMLGYLQFFIDEEDIIITIIIINNMH